MVYFHTDWCGFCDELEKNTFTDERIIREAQHFKCLRVDGDAHKKTASKYGVDAYPTVLFFNASGEEYNRIEGYVGPDEFLQSMVTGKSPPTSPTCSLKALNWVLYSLLGAVFLISIGGYFLKKIRN